MAARPKSESVGVISRRSIDDALGIDSVLNQQSQNQIPLKFQQALSGKKKLAIISYFMKSGMAFEMYVVDLDLDAIFIGHVPTHYLDIEPRISLEFKGEVENWVGCVLKSTLYIFQERDRRISFFDDVDTDEKKVKKLVLSLDFLNMDKKIEDLEEFESVCPMTYPKHHPVAVPTPDGEKILVFQSIIDTSHIDTCFELYDPSTDNWTVLEPPELPLGEPWIIIEGYTFIDESRFLLATGYGKYLVNLKSERKDRRPVWVPKMWTCHSIVIGDRVVIGPGVVSEIESGDGREFSLSPFPSPRLRTPEWGGIEQYFSPEPFITLLDQKDGDAYTLVSQVQAFIGPDETEDRAWDSCIHRSYLLIDICRTNLKTLKTTMAGALKYIIYRGGIGGDIYGHTMFIFEPDH